MKRKIVALILALTFCMSLSVTAFAETVRDSGQTNGKTSQIGSYAELYADRNRCEATTEADVCDEDLVFSTSVIYYYIDSRGMMQTDSDSGTTSAGAGTLNYNSGEYATSQHRAKGNSTFGNWSCSLRADA